MRYKRLGRTNLQVSEIALGTVELGLVYGIARPGEPPVPDEAEAAAILNRAVDGGINLIDTARGYGTAEEVIGRALGSRRKEIILASKFQFFGADRILLTGEALRNQFQNSLETSLRLLQTDWLDLYQVHAGADPEFLHRGEVVELLKEAKAAGKIRFAGLSSYGQVVPSVALELNFFDTLQMAYNVLDRRMAPQVLPIAHRFDVGVIIRSALLKGALTERGDYLPERVAPVRERSRAFRQIAASLPGQPTPVQVALRFCLAHPAVSTALIGVRNMAEVEEAVGITQVPDLDQQTLARLEPLQLEDESMLDAGTWGIP